MRLIIPAYFKAYNKSGKLTDYALTSNHMYIPIHSTGRGSMLVIKPEAQVWYDEAAWRAKLWVAKTGWKMPDKMTQVAMRVWYFFKDNKHADAGNYHKALGDFAKGIILADDKKLLWQDQGIEIDKQNARIELEYQVVK